MTAPLYFQLAQQKTKPGVAHAGLWFDRFFDRYEVKGSNWEIPKPGDHGDPKRDWINTLKEPVGKKRQLQQYKERRSALMMQLNGRSERFEANWHFVTGMGNPHPVENGLSWHHTLGVPYLTGAAVKGLVRAWVEINDDGLDDECKRARLKHWFGTENKDEVPEQAGSFLFFDALPDQQVELICDIMTPHMGKWYSDGSEADVNKPETIPADWHEPVPIPFLVTKKTGLVFSIAPRQPQWTDELDAVFTALTQALEWLGAGAKTAAGYGYFSLDERFSQIEKAEEERRLIAIEEKKRLDGLSPLDQKIESLLKPIQAAEHDTFLLKELEKGTWQGDDAKAVAEKIKALMVKNAKWMPDFSGTNKDKLKLKTRSLTVLKFLQD